MEATAQKRPNNLEKTSIAINSGVLRWIRKLAKTSRRSMASVIEEACREKMARANNK